MENSGNAPAAVATVRKSTDKPVRVPAGRASKNPAKGPDKNPAKNPTRKPAKKPDLFSFRELGRSIDLDGVEAEFGLMREAMKHSLTVDVARRICEKSGSHLLKMVNPRVESDQACLTFEEPGSNRRPVVLPSTNASDIPFCKAVWRPLEIGGHPSMSVVDHITNPTDISAAVLDAFARVFGAGVLDAMRRALLTPPKPIVRLTVGEFPIVFIPRPGGGDLQVTPVSPATAFNGMKDVTRAFFLKIEPGVETPPRGRWHHQAVSAQPQNISGAISGMRVRFLATMPSSLTQWDAEIYRFVRGGSFPRRRDADDAVWILRYARMLEADATFNNQDTRRALDRTADRLARDAETFIEETLQDARAHALQHGLSAQDMPAPPEVAIVLLRQRWESDLDYGEARKALTSPHFDHRLQLRRKGRKG